MNVADSAILLGSMVAGGFAGLAVAWLIERWRHG